MVKGWVRTVRKQKTLAFVEVNDGSNLGGIQCVLSFDDIDDLTREGMANIVFSVILSDVMTAGVHILEYCVLLSYTPVFCALTSEHALAFEQK